MVSNVDVTKPTEGQAYTKDVRNNFSIIKTEIESLQDALDEIPPVDLSGPLNVTGETNWGIDLINVTVGGDSAKSGILFIDNNDVAFGFTLENGQFYIASGTSIGSNKGFLRFNVSGVSITSAATFSGMTSDKIDFRTGYVCMVSLPTVAQGDSTRIWNHGGVLNIGAGAALVTQEHLDELNSKISTLTKRIVLLESHLPARSN